ncbi:hypothetical protein BXZ70DRAFT_1012438 [Cristinia sonorae]|uniref:F-box domain-containing protein n=1 Tax=Cristinia sonorae TaxID=1940300 RepID=A0A8K0UGL8_9AGAR|nr:hypothetical protein BXZ70DRAFT_1012438 [Cristinia sonorae]
MDSAVFSQQSQQAISHQESAELQPPQSTADSLPPEILSKIFSHVAADDKNFAYLKNILHVCRYWRAVAIEVPHFWNHIEIGTTAQDGEITTPTSLPMDLLLTWSKQVPLTIFALALATPHEINSLRLVLAEIGRVFTLDIELTQEVVELFLEIRPLSAPLLSRLRVTYAENACDVSGPFFNSLHAPTLSELELSGYPPDVDALTWSSHYFPPTLTHLMVDSYIFLDPHPYVVSEAIRHLQLLEYLEFLFCVDTAYQILPNNVPHSSSRPPVILPHLKKLVITSATTEEWASFMEYVSIPLSTQVRIHLFNGSVSVEPASLLVDLLRRRLLRKASHLNTEDAVVGVPDVDMVTVGYCTIKFHHSGSSQSHFLSSAPYILNLFQWFDSKMAEAYRWHMQAVPLLLAAIPLHNITVLSLLHLPECRDTVLALEEHRFAMLGSFTNVTTLILRRKPSVYWDWSHDAAISILEVHRLPTASSIRTILFPRLKHLQLSHVGMNGDKGATTPLKFVDDLCAVLEARKGAGFGIHDVFLEECCDVNETVIRKLERVVPVVWDGYSRSTSGTLDLHHRVVLQRVDRPSGEA